MESVIDGLLRKIREDPRVTARGGARQDLGLLLFAEREAISELWKAADRSTREPEAAAELKRAVERLRALFGERDG